MRQMTLRDIPDEIEAVVRAEAGLRGVSLNKAFLSLLTRGAQHVQAASVQVVRPKGRFARFCGVWTDEEAGVFDTSTDKQRSIDRELWQ